MKISKVFSVLLSLLVAFSLFPISSFAQTEDEDVIEVEGAPLDPSIDPMGPRHQISYIDEDLESKADFIMLYTSEFATEVTVKKNWVAVQVDENNTVTKVVNQSVNGAPPVWEDEQSLAIPEGGYVLLAHDDSWATKNFRKFLAANFKDGDVIKLRKNGEVVPITEFMTGNGLKASINLQNEKMYTLTESQADISGSIQNFESDQTYRLVINEQEVELQEDGLFQYVYELSKGTNYIDVKIYKNDILHDMESLIVYYQDNPSAEKEVFLWVEQGPNARRFQSSEDVRSMLLEAKDAGVTAVVLDVKGVEGFASYQKNDLTNRPYVSEMTAEGRAGSNPELDLLQEFIDHGHQLDIEVHASFNVFAEGSIAHNEYAVLEDHPEWEEMVYRSEDNGAILPLRESAYGKKGALVAFVNPSNPEVRDYQLKTFEEVMKNYDVDGVLLDRGRYDNYFADFSDLSRTQFEEYLAEQGKTLTNWPQDVFYYEGSNRVDGPLINEWFTFRSSVINSYLEETRELVDQYNLSQSRDIQLSAYVGSWYESYYLNGVNWSSPTFTYDSRLEFPQDSLYGEDYAETAYTDKLDFLMIGTYQTTAQEINKYITLGNILTDGKVPLYAGMALVNVQDPSLQREVFQAGLQNTSGLMLFDYSQANFPVIKASIADEEYVKDYVLGISNPTDPENPFAGDFLNINRNDDNLNVFSDSFGLSTATNKWGVEAVVDASGEVVKMVNKEQAMNWNWTNVDDNNSQIPEGGFVISALDRSGAREKRVLVANNFDIGDRVRSASLSGSLNYEGKSFSTAGFEYEGKVDAIGPGEAKVFVNGEEAAVQSSGEFSLPVSLQPGENQIDIVVYVDDYKTHNQVVTVFGEEAAGFDEVIQFVEEADFPNKGIQQAILSKLQNAKRDFDAARTHEENGLIEQAEKARVKGNKKLDDLHSFVQKHAGKHILAEVAEQLGGYIEKLKED
ncbi:MAG: family 10 glycosylhydrolase [Cytobacillus gottheilii]|uniref:family 10 glycosylhydrolase n=1 Tax=Cytobacillus gottheilii TaxID=859144 RepID=UPI00082AD2EB|nr:family 10 glycosylhydrolase [Cytobacillus gottheilii]